ncbi:MAG TPA: hypothetical protein VIN08_28135 [Ohtaekwangia sp.]|uniref:hypothetical protein n=1 Tax=Ohtaekwangia sp. TaxID=2066019 RepID=UPI002F9477BA
MPVPLNLLEETLSHLQEGARSVRAYSGDATYIITKAGDREFYVTLEEPPFTKTKTASLESYFKDVFGIDARY